jgi:hypothetical protein
MRMGIALALALVMGISGLVGVSSKAFAVNSNISGSACRNYNARDVTDIDYLPNGVRNVNVSSRLVICPIVRSPTSTNAVGVYVDGFVPPGNTIACTLFSYNIDGSFGSQAFTAQPGTFDQFVTVPGSYWGNANVLCSLPGNISGQIYDIDVVQ